MSHSTSLHKRWWVDRLEKNRDYYDAPVNVSSGWEASSQAEHLLINALRAADADALKVVVYKFAEAAVAIVDNAVAENTFEQGKLAQGAFPRNRAVALRARSYAEALLGESLPTDDLRQASRDFETRAKEMWNHQYEAYYLNCVRAALIAGDQERFVSLLNTRRQFKFHLEEYGALRRLADELPLKSSSLSTASRDRFRVLFDKYRNPEFKPDIYLELEIVSFESGAIWCQLFDKRPTFIWQEVINAVSA